MKNPNLIVKLRDSLPPPTRNLLDELLLLAEKRGAQAYLVGGPVRDLLIERTSVDLDIAVEGDAVALARELAEAAGGRAVTHPAFLTATVRIPAFHLDLITARSEIYARPGALPTVKPTTIREDLLRRDFTVNALALRLTGPDTGEILDPSGGLRDLDARLIRVLHERSFQDDATRILRACRYASRLDFEIERDTLTWLKRDLSYLDTISSARLHHEFARVLAEDTPEAALLRLDEAGALAAIHPAFHFDREHAAAFARLRELHPTGARSAYLPALAWRLTEAEAAELARRLALTRAQRAALEAMPALRDLEPVLAQPRSRRDASARRLGAVGGRTTPRTPFKRSAIAEMLSPFPLPALWAFAALTAVRVRDRLLDYLTKARHERPYLTGDDLLTMGLPEGRAVGDILRRLRSGRLDHETVTREDERRLVRRLLAEGDKAQLPGKGKVPSRSS